MKFLLIVVLVVALSEAANYVRVPGGYLAPEECIHHLKADEVYDDVNHVVYSISTGKQLRSVPICPLSPLLSSKRNLGHGAAWRAWAEYDIKPAKLGIFTTDWVVPPQPVSHVGQIVYLWNGIEPSDTSAVIQPVLQWGSTPAGGGNYWAVASWYVSSAHGWHVGNLVKCNPGDTIRGTMQTWANGTWAIIATVMSNGQNATLDFKPVDSDKFTYLFQVLEAYNLGKTQCNGAYPSEPETFKNINVIDNNGNQITPKWVAKVQDDSCGEHATIESNGDVTIHYHP